MPTYCALTVRKLKPGSYDEWRTAWGGDDVPEEAEVYILRSLQDPDEIIAFGLIDGNIDEIKAGMDPEADKARQEAMAPHVESVGADSVYEVIEHIGAKTGARA